MLLGVFNLIAFVEGIVRLIRSNSVVLDVNGVGYEVFMNHAVTQRLGESLFLYTYQQVREDAMLLYGFKREEDYEVFMRLINVKGIGPKLALGVLEACSGKDLIDAIERDDIKRLKALPGIGAKTAGQIVLDLKGKFVSLDIESEDVVKESMAWKQTEEALLSLGYRANQLTNVKKELAHLDLDVNTLLKRALAFLAKQSGV